MDVNSLSTLLATTDRRWEMLPPAWGVIVLVLLLALTWFTCRVYGPHTRLVILRLATYGLLAWMVLGVVEYRYEVELPRLILLLDNSLSMSRPIPRPKGTAKPEPNLPVGTRWSEVERLLESMPEPVWSRYQIELATLNSPPTRIQDVSQLHAELLKVRADVPVSELTQRVDQLAASLVTPTAAIILFTDTMETGPHTWRDSAPQLASRNIVFSIAAIGASASAAQSQVVTLSYPRQAHLGEKAMLDIELANLTTEPLAFEMTAVDSETGVILTRSPVRLPAADGAHQPQPSASHRIKLTVPLERAGGLSFQLQATTADSSARPVTLVGPELSGTISVLTSPTRVLLVDGYPRYEFRYLQNLLERSSRSSSELPPDFKLSSILLDADPDWSDQSAVPLPLDERAMSDFDVIILGDVPPQSLPRSMLSALVDWIDRGGGSLVIVPGERHMPSEFVATPLAPLLPPVARPSLANPTVASPTLLSWRLTEAGQSLSVTQLTDDPEANDRAWRKLPPVQWWMPMQEVSSGVMVVADGQPQSTTGITSGTAVNPALISWRYFGMGRVVWHGTDETWRWRFRSDETLYARYWKQLLRYLTPLPNPDHRPVQLTAARPVFEPGTPVRLVAELLDPAWLGGANELTVEVRSNQGPSENTPIPTLRLRPTADESRRFVGDLTSLPSGTYTGRIVQPSGAETTSECTFAVESSRNESSELPTPLDDLLRLTSPTGGHVWAGDELPMLWRQLPAAKSLPGRELKSRPWWSVWPIPLAIITLLAAEWWLRHQGDHSIASITSASEQE